MRPEVILYTLFFINFRDWFPARCQGAANVQARSLLRSQALQFPDVPRGPFRGADRRCGGAAAGHGVRHRMRTAAGTRALYRHRGGIPDLALRRLPGSDRRADGGIHHHHRVDRRAARARGTGGQHAAGWSIPDPARVIPHGRTHQIRAVPGRDRLHLRHRGRDLLDPAQGDPRAQGRSVSVRRRSSSAAANWSRAFPPC